MAGPDAGGPARYDFPNRNFSSLKARTVKAARPAAQSSVEAMQSAICTGSTGSPRSKRQAIGYSPKAGTASIQGFSLMGTSASTMPGVAADPRRDQQVRSVEAILRDLGLSEKKRVLVFSKVDRLLWDEGLVAFADVEAGAPPPPPRSEA